MASAVELFSKSQDPIVPRTREDITRMFDGFELVEPGIVYTPEWRLKRPEEVGNNARRSILYAGVWLQAVVHSFGVQAESPLVRVEGGASCPFGCRVVLSNHYPH
jgi:hypothetical protein